MSVMYQWPIMLVLCKWYVTSVLHLSSIMSVLYRCSVMCVGEGTHPRGRDLPVLGVCHRLLWYRLWCVLWVDDRSKYDSECDGQWVQRWGRVRRGARSGLIANYWPITWLWTNNYSCYTWFFMLVYQYLKFSVLGQRDVISFLSYLMLAVEFVLGFRNVSIIVIF